MLSNQFSFFFLTLRLLKLFASFLWFLHNVVKKLSWRSTAIFVFCCCFCNFNKFELTSFIWSNICCKLRCSFSRCSSWSFVENRKRFENGICWVIKRFFDLVAVLLDDARFDDVVFLVTISSSESSFSSTAYDESSSLVASA